LLTSLEDMELKELPKSPIIVGGGYIALELGQMFSRFGTEVTILERGERNGLPSSAQWVSTPRFRANAIAASWTRTATRSV